MCHEFDSSPDSSIVRSRLAEFFRRHFGKQKEEERAEAVPPTSDPQPAKPEKERDAIPA
jgi:hypothetical protein